MIYCYFSSKKTTDFYCYVYPIKFTVLKIFSSADFICSVAFSFFVHHLHALLLHVHIFFIGTPNFKEAWKFLNLFSLAVVRNSVCSYFNHLNTNSDVYSARYGIFWYYKLFKNLAVFLNSTILKTKHSVPEWKELNTQMYEWEGEGGLICNVAINVKLFVYIVRWGSVECVIWWHFNTYIHHQIYCKYLYLWMCMCMHKNSSLPISFSTVANKIFVDPNNFDRYKFTCF